MQNAHEIYKPLNLMKITVKKKTTELCQKS